MTKVNLKQLWKIAKTNNQPLLGLSTDLSTLNFMSDYLTKTEAFDREIARERGFFWPVWNLDEEETEEDVFEQWQKDVYYHLYKNKENYQRLYDLLSIEYEPLTNYDKHSYITEIDNGQDQTTDALGARHTEDDYASKQNTDAYGAVSTSDSIGARSDSTVYGEKSSTDNYGAKTATDNFGAVSTSDTKGAKTSSAEDKVAGFNSSTYVNSNTSSISDGAQTDSHSEIARSDSHSEGAREDTHSEATYTDQENIGAQSNSHTEQAKTDTHTEGAHLDKHDERAVTDTHTIAYGKEHSYDEHTTGNIGVTTSQQMAQSEIDLWNSFKFYDILIGDIIKNLCHYYQPGDESI